MSTVNDMLPMMEKLFELSIEELTRVIQETDDDKVRVAAIAQARGLLKDSGVAINIGADNSTVPVLANVVSLEGKLPFKTPANG